MTQGHKIAVVVGVILLPFNLSVGAGLIALTVYDSRRMWKQ